MLTGRDVPATEAVAMGLVDHVVERKDFEAESRRFVQQLGGVPTAVSRNIKALVDHVSPLTSPATEAQAVRAFASTWVSEDHWEAVERDAQRRRAARGR